MVDTTNANKKITSKKKIRSRSRSQKEDIAERWLNESENFLRPCVADNCTNPSDKQTLKRQFTKRMVRLAILTTDFCGVDWFDYDSLDQPCKTGVYEWYEWYFSTVFPDKPEKRTTEKIFSLTVKENAFKQITSNAEYLLDKMCRERRYSISDLTKSEIESQKVYYENNKNVWQSTLKQLREQIEENQIQIRGGRVD